MTPAVTSFDPLALARTLGLAWASPPAVEAHADFVELHGEVEAHPAPEELEKALVALGFECTHSLGPALPRQAPTHTVNGKRGAERLRVVLLGATRDGRGATQTQRLTFTWESRRRPPIDGDAHVWSARRWPMFFEEPRLHFESNAMLVIEGKLGATTDFERCRDRYERWASESGFASHTSFEPDLAGDLAVADADFEVTLTNRAPWVTLTVARRAE